MNLDALPHTVLLILVEFSVGSLIAVLVIDARGMVPASYVKLSAGIIGVVAALMLWSALSVSGADLDGFRLESGLFGPIRAATAVFFALSLVYVVLTYRGDRERSLLVGGVGAVVGVDAVACGGVCRMGFGGGATRFGGGSTGS